MELSDKGSISSIGAAWGPGKEEDTQHKPRGQAVGSQLSRAAAHAGVLAGRQLPNSATCVAQGATRKHSLVGLDLKNMTHATSSGFDSLILQKAAQIPEPCEASSVWTDARLEDIFTILAHGFTRPSTSPFT